MTACNHVPRSIWQGNSVSWGEMWAEYLSSVYFFQIAFAKNGLNIQLFTAQDNADGSFQMVLTAAQTALLAPGENYITGLVFDEASPPNRYTVFDDRCYVRPNPAIPITPTLAMQQLAALEAALSALIANPLKSTSALGQTYTKQDFTILMDARDRADAKVDAELRAMGLSTRGGTKTIRYRFGGKGW